MQCANVKGKMTHSYWDHLKDFGTISERQTQTETSHTWTHNRLLYTQPSFHCANSLVNSVSQLHPARKVVDLFSIVPYCLHLLWVIYFIKLAIVWQSVISRNKIELLMWLVSVAYWIETVNDFVQLSKTTKLVHDGIKLFSTNPSYFLPCILSC